MGAGTGGAKANPSAPAALAGTVDALRRTLPAGSRFAMAWRHPTLGHGCTGSPAQGRVHEIFAQTNQAERFAAQPLTGDALDAALGRQAPCAGDRAVFELRYLPEGAALRRP